MKLSRRALPMLGALALPLRAQAQAFPNRPVRVITPFAAGLGAETTLRLFADALARRWGQPVPVENRPGGDGLSGDQ
jgi:tripartite-type tricarboxylate transporter receptor subunit TctC